MSRRTPASLSKSARTPSRSCLEAIFSLTRPVLPLALGLGLLAEGTGCTRRFYRDQVDKEAVEVVAQKDKYPDWKVENWNIYPDPRARFATTDDPDHPAKPPDDPAAYDLSPNPQKPGKAGIKRIEGTGYLDLIAKWDRENRERMAREEEVQQKEWEPPLAEPGETGKKAASEGQRTAGQPAEPKTLPPAGPAANGSNSVEPGYRDVLVEGAGRTSLDITGRPTYLLTLDQAAELGMFNSREFQDQREDLYLAALPVALERFSFAAQFLAGQEAIREYTGQKTPEGASNGWAMNSGVGLSKLLPTGALLLLNFSNQTVFDFLNPKKTISGTTLNFSAVQPLLQGGGRR